MAMKGIEFEKEVTDRNPAVGGSGVADGFKIGKNGFPISRRTGTQIKYRGAGIGYVDKILDALDRERGDR